MDSLESKMDAILNSEELVSLDEDLKEIEEMKNELAELGVTDEEENEETQRAEEDVNVSTECLKTNTDHKGKESSQTKKETEIFVKE